MKIIVTSQNPIKIEAVRQAFESQFPGQALSLIPVAVESGVSEQPMSDAETRQGARNRVENAKPQHIDADFRVGLEGGLDVFDGHLMAFAWMVVANRDDRISETRSATLPLPPEIQKLVLAGMELGDANDQVFSTLNSKQGGGAFGLLTDGLLTRESIYTQTMILALIPFVHELWP
jgi:inosine/xanthosine triphosphatase